MQLFLYNKFSAFLVAGLLLIHFVSGCEKKRSPEKAPGEAKPVAGKTVFSKPTGMNVKETKLADIPKDFMQWREIFYSADGRQVSYVAQKNGKEVMVTEIAGEERITGGYDEISFLARSFDGLRSAFGGKAGGKKHLVLDGIEMPEPYHEEVAPSSFSPDGRFVACEVGGIHENQWFIALFDKEKEIYRSPVFSNSNMFPVFSPDSRLLVFSLGDTKKNTVFFFDVLNRKVIKEQVYAGFHTGSFSFSSDSSRVVYEAQKDGKKFLVLQDFGRNQERRAELPGWAGYFELTPDGKHVVYNVLREAKQYVVVGPWEAPERGKASRPYDAISKPVIGPDATTVAFYAMRAGKWIGVVGDSEYPAEYDGVGDAPMTFSPNGLTLAYAARKGGTQDKTGVIGGKWVMVVLHVGQAGTAKEGPSYDMVVSPVFSPDGRRIAYRARTGSIDKAKRFIVTADADTGNVIRKGPVCDEIWPPVWSADGKNVGYGARIGRELWWKVENLL